MLVKKCFEFLHSFTIAIYPTKFFGIHFMDCFLDSHISASV